MEHQGNTGVDRRALALANRQFGVLSYADLVACGLTPGAIRFRLENGNLTRLHHRAYAFGHRALRPEGRWLAAQLACGPLAVISHVSAAAFHGMRREEPASPVHVSTTESIKSRPGIVVHRVRTLPRVDVFHTQPLLVTTIPRTLVDLADMFAWDDYRAAADRVPELRLGKGRQAQERAPGRGGSPLVRRLIEADDAHTKSEFERRFLKFSSRLSVTRPDRLNVKVAGHKADCVYDQARLVIELDGRTYHRRRAQMRADRQRDTNYQLAGYRIVRLVWDDLHLHEAARTAARVRAMLGTRAS